MGIYFVLANHTKREFLNPHAYNSGTKISEFTNSPEFFEHIVDLLCKHIDGSWIGDDIEFIGDEHDQAKWSQAHEYKDVSDWEYGGK